MSWGWGTICDTIHDPYIVTCPVYTGKGRLELDHVPNVYNRVFSMYV